MGPLVHFFPGLAGRHSVNIESPAFSNPFVDWHKRHLDAQRMLHALESCNAAQFEQVSAHYGRVRYVLVSSNQLTTGNLFVPTCPEALPIVDRNGGVIVYRIDFRGLRAVRNP